MEARPGFTVGLCVRARFAVRFCVSGVCDRSESEELSVLVPDMREGEGAGLLRAELGVAADGARVLERIVSAGTPDVSYVPEAKMRVVTEALWLGV